MKSFLHIILVMAVGVLLAVGSFYYLAGWYNVVPWAIVSLIIGYRCNSIKQSLLLGAVFGYFLFLAYIFWSYSGKPDTPSLEKFILFDVGFSLIGAVVGAGGSFAGFWLKKSGRK